MTSLLGRLSESPPRSIDALFATLGWNSPFIRDDNTAAFFSAEQVLHSLSLHCHRSNGPILPQDVGANRSSSNGTNSAVSFRSWLPSSTAKNKSGDDHEEDGNCLAAALDSYYTARLKSLLSLGRDPGLVSMRAVLWNESLNHGAQQQMQDH